MNRPQHPLPPLFLGKVLKGSTSRFEHLEKRRLNFSSSLFTIRVNLLHLYPSLLLYGLLLSVITSVFFYLGKLLFSGFFNQNTVIKLLQGPEGREHFKVQNLNQGKTGKKSLSLHFKRFGEQTKYQALLRS